MTLVCQDSTFFERHIMLPQPAYGWIHRFMFAHVNNLLLLLDYIPSCGEGVARYLNRRQTLLVASRNQDFVRRCEQD